MSLKVAKNDDGIRPAGKDDECFYCNSKVGETHKTDCVIPTKRVKVKVTMEIEIEVPHGRNNESTEFQYNESSYCADNFINEIQKYLDYQGDSGCMCFDHNFSVKVLQTIDSNPIILGNGETRCPKDDRDKMDDWYK